MKRNRSYLKEVSILAIGELIVSALVVLGYYICSLLFETYFGYRVFTGVLLGALVTVINYLLLVLTVNNQVDKYLAVRGSTPMSDEEAAKFTAEHSMKIQNAIKISFIVRTVSMLAALALAFLLDWFSPIATAIPLLAYRPILSVGELIRRRFDKTPDPANYINYNEENNENEEEKESDE